MKEAGRRLLKSHMAMSGMDGKKLAKEIGISALSFYRKMNGQSAWTMPEANLVCAATGIKDLETRARIFLND